jgi:glycosyltransferase involved in cell wall biosynthesis
MIGGRSALEDVAADGSHASTVVRDSVIRTTPLPLSKSSPMPAVGIVIPSHNTQRFVAAAIESALNQDHPNVRVVVVDDGSTDGSRLLLEAYRERATIIFQTNVGQLGACRRGAAILTTPIVIFLDADDVLLPQAASTVARAWRPGIAKIQYRLEVIDEAGVPTGVVFPKYPPELSPENVYEELLRTGAYICPPGLGNAYALETIAELPTTETMPPFADAVFATLAPLYGDVVTLPVTIGQYRVHGNNAWSMQRLEMDKLERRCATEVDRTLFLEQICHQRGIPFEARRALRRLLSYQEHRLAIAKFGTHGWRAYPRAVGALGDVLPAVFKSHLRLGHRLLLALWACFVAIFPQPVARAVALQRLSPIARWSAIERLVRRLL